jgi:hypothetical protein
MIQTADIKPKIMRLWGNPAITELSPQSLRDSVESVWNIITMEMSIVSPTYNTTFSETFTTGSDWTGSVGVSDLAIPIAIEYRTSGSTGENAWTQIDTGGIENWDYYKSINQPVALLTGGVGDVTLRTNFDALGGEFRLRYIADNAIGDSASPLGSTIDLPSFFSPMFEKGAAAMCGDLIVTDREVFAASIPAKTQGFNAEFLMLLSRYKQWLRNSRSGKGISYRTPSNAGRTGLHFRRRWNLGIPR